MRNVLVLTLSGLLLTSNSVISFAATDATTDATTTNPSSALNTCLLKRLQQADDTTTVSEIRAYCNVKYSSQPVLVEQTVTSDVASSTAAEESVNLRLKSEAAAESNPFILAAYQPNYLLFASYNEKKNEEPFEEIFPDGNMDEIEAKYQLSFQARIARGVLGGEVWGAYTQQAWWQVYNADQSAPFRETNYEPEVFLRWETDFDILGFNTRTIKFGFNHESNGRGQLLSRSWNRIIAGATFERGNLAILGRVWYRLPEDKDDDDNPGIVDHMGYGDFRAFYKWQQNVLGMTLTNNLRSDNKGGVQLDWTFPLTERFRAYIQYYNGYGESLIDHDSYTNRVSVGVLLNDWL